MNLELFSCSGGMAEGFRRAGVEFDMVVDKNSDACDSYECNLRQRPVQMDANDLLRMVELGWGTDVELLVADPPCTPWSRAGKRQGTEDERDCLETTVELITALKPTCFLIANVPGLDDAPNWPIVQRLIGGIAKVGYCVGDFARLDAADFGVPQHRVRPFWFGHRQGTSCLTWPSRTHGPPEELQTTLPGLGSLLPWVTCADALCHLSLDELGRPVRLRKRSDKHPSSTPDAPAKTVASSQPGNGGALLVHKRHPPSELDKPARTVLSSDGGGAKGSLLVMRQRGDGSVREHYADAPAHTIRANRSSTERLILTDHGHHHESGKPARTVVTGGPGREVLSWPWNRPATTLQCDNRLAPPGRRPAEGMGSVLSSPDAIVLSERAAAILQGFPPDWVFCGKTKRSRWSQIGQAMPPGLAEPVARQIASWLTLNAGRIAS